jgi:hypothetical protein
MGKDLKLEDLEVYRTAMDIAEEIWAIIAKWDYFSKKVVGEQ